MASLTQAAFLKQQDKIREDFKAMAKIFPGAFDSRNKPIVAELRLYPPPVSEGKNHGPSKER